MAHSRLVVAVVAGCIATVGCNLKGKRSLGDTSGAAEQANAQIVTGGKKQIATPLKNPVLPKTNTSETSAPAGGAPLCGSCYDPNMMDGGLRF